MPVALPSLCPIERRYTAGAFPTRRFSSIAGATTTRLYGSKSSGDRLSLKFATTDAEAAAVLAAYQAARGDYDYLTLPPAYWAGAAGGLAAAPPAYLRWRFDTPPQVTSVFPGRSEVAMELIGVLDA